MVSMNNQQSLFLKYVTSTLWVILIAGIHQNEVNAATLHAPGSIKENENTCEHTCNSGICRYEANRLNYIMDESVDPCDDFFHFACGKFRNFYTLNDEHNIESLFSVVQNQIDGQIYNLLNTRTYSYPNFFQKVQDYYHSCLNANETLYNVFKIFDNIGGFPALLGNNWNEDGYDWTDGVYNVMDQNILIAFPITASISNEKVNSTKNIYMAQAATFNINNEVHDMHQKFIVESLVKLGADENVAKEDIENMLKFNFNLAKISPRAEQLANQNDDDKVVTVDTLSHKYPSIPWLKLLNKIFNRNGVFVNPSDVVILQDKQYIDRLENLINQTPKRTIANYIAWSVLRYIYTFLPKIFEDLAVFYFGNQYLTFDNSGRRYTFCLNTVKTIFPIAISAMYVRQYLAPHFHEEMKKDVEQIVYNVRKQVEASINETAWMDDDTRNAALRKLNNMHEYVGYEKELLYDEKIDQYYSKLKFVPNSYLTNSIALADWQRGLNFKSSSENFEYTSWMARDATNFNAQYIYGGNLIDIPAALLQDFMYIYDRPQYLNYGSLGSIIGHEIIHGFDNTGREYDENGYQNNWWSEDTKQEYLKNAQCIIDQYNNFVIPSINLPVNGVSTQNENIADNGGFIAAYRAYNKWAKNQHYPEGCLPGLKYTPKQMFWISSAMNWCIKDGTEYLKNLIRIDTHSPNLARVINSFSNVKEFAEDFQCKVGSRMNPEKKCVLW